MARRVGKNILQREDFIILTNGKQTEKNYFELLKSKRSVYEVKIEHRNCDPLALVDFALRTVIPYLKILSASGTHAQQCINWYKH